MSGNTINQFWYDTNYKVSDTIKLCPLRLMSIKSYLMNGYTVNFWTYQKIGNMFDHKNLHVRDAREIVSEKEFKGYKITSVKPKRYQKNKELHIANFSDYLRPLIIYKEGGWWVDTDTYCLNKFPKPDKLDNGVIFASLPAKVDGSRGVRHHLCVETTKERKSGIWKGWDGRSQFSNAIMYGDKGHPLMKKISKNIKDNLKTEWIYGFIQPMFMTYDVVKKEGYMNSIRPPLAFIPICWWNSKMLYTENNNKKLRTSYGAHIPTYNQVVKNSYCVHFYNGMFAYLFDKKENVSKQLFKYLCDRYDMDIKVSDIVSDKYKNNFHVKTTKHKLNVVDDTESDSNDSGKRRKRRRID